MNPAFNANPAKNRIKTAVPASDDCVEEYLVIESKSYEPDFTAKYMKASISSTMLI